MPIHIRFQGVAEPGKQPQLFNDDVQKIAIGRDPARCQIVFPENDTLVGREHCILERQAGRYRVRVNQEDVVLCDGKRMADNDQLPLERECKLQIGKQGPTLLVRTFLAGKPTTGTEPAPNMSAQVSQLRRRVGIGLLATLAGLILVAAALGVGVMLNWKWADSVANQLTQVFHRQDTSEKTITTIGETQVNTTKKLTDLEKLALERQKRLSDAANAVRGSLMLIGYAGDPNDPNAKSAIATGFVISLEKRLIATNAHVADLLGTAPALYAIPDRATTQKFEVERVYYHPGVVRISPQGPRKRSMSPGDGQVDQFSPDVAVLQLKQDGKPLPAGITQVELATPQELEKLPGLEVGMSGYPGEQTSFPANGKTFTADNRDGNINHVTDFDGKHDPESSNDQLVAYTMATENGFSGSPVFDTSGHVVAINNSHHKNEGGSSQTYGIRIDCLWELLQHYGPDKLIPPPKGWNQGQMQAHTNPDLPIDAAGVWNAVHSLQTAQLLDLPGEATVAGPSFEQKEQVCNDSVAAAKDFPFVYLARGRLYGKKSDDPKLSPADRVKYLNNAETDFKRAIELGPRHAPPLDPNCFEAKLWLCRIDTVKAGLPVPQNLQEPSTIVGVVDQILQDKTAPLTKRLEALGWRIRARCHFTSPETASDLDHAVTALPQLPENLLLRAEYLESPPVQRPDDAKKDRDHADQIQKAIAKAHAALSKAQEWKNTHPAGDTSGIDPARSQAAEAVDQTGNQEWNCLDAYAHIRAMAGDQGNAIQTALQAQQWAPDATEKFHSEEDVYEFRSPHQKSP